MKTLFRILVILIIASMIGGLMYAGVSAAGDAPSLENERPRLPEGEQFRPEREGPAERDGIDLPGGMVKALALMSIAGGIYSATVWAGRKAKQVPVR
ncbi:MAG: hypothetical protein Q8L87_20780 [Anaerolineales bacterium]|jgi:hypothetical protein|nr:hypothetical protein [Anaerolineales bacterium]